MIVITVTYCFNCIKPRIALTPLSKNRDKLKWNFLRRHKPIRFFKINIFYLHPFWKLPIKSIKKVDKSQVCQSHTRTHHPYATKRQQLKVQTLVVNLIVLNNATYRINN